MSDRIDMNIPTQRNISMNIVNSEGGIGMNINTSGGGTKDHSKLKNLDYEHSGHTGFQKEIDFDNKIASDLIDDTQSNNKFVSIQEKGYWNNKSDFSGDYDDLTNKPNIPIKLSELTNDVGFITNTVNNLTNYYLKSETYTKDEVNTLIGQISTVSILVVQQLPQTGETNIIYFVPREIPNVNDIYNEYIYVNNNWELIGNTQIDLSNYYTKTETNTLLSGKQNEITSSNKLDSDLISDVNQTNKFVTANEKTTWNNAVQPNDLGAVAFSNDYADLSNRPSVFQIRTALSSNSNLNNLLTGIYEIRNVAHNDFPITGACFGVLVQYSGDYKPQVFIAGGAGECHMYYRRWLTGSSSWTPWENANDTTWITYNTTTYAEITSLIANNKNILCLYNDRVYRYTSSSNDYYYFTCLTSTTGSWQIRVSSSNVWNSTSATLQRTANMIKTTDTDTPSDDTYYSSLVINNKIGDIETLLYTLNSGGGAS